MARPSPAPASLDRERSFATSLALSEEQELLAATAAEFVRERSPLARLRELRDRRDPRGFSPSLWKEMAALGWVGITLPEEYGGSGMGLSELTLVLEALGRNLAPEPFLSTVLLGAGLLQLAGGETQCRDWLPGVAAGEKFLALADRELRSRHDCFHITARATRDREGFRLSGEKHQVLDGASADALLVAARSGGGPRDREGISLFLIPGDTPGLRMTPQGRIDSRGVALVQLDDVAAPATALLGAEGGGGAALAQAVDRATVGLCAEMLGGMAQVFEDTLVHLRSRVQFGVPIGSFQALKHRAARIFIEIELCKSAVRAAAQALDNAAADAAALVSLAKARCSEAYVLAANEAIQMFGGVGMTDEYDLGFYLKRARVAEMSFGDAAWHRDRWARLRGY